MASGADSPRQGRRGSLGTWPTPAPRAPGLRGLQRAAGGFCLGGGGGEETAPKGDLECTQKACLWPPFDWGNPGMSHNIPSTLLFPSPFLRS